jgi:aspartate/methionine/tyrosine aminotransferase
VPADRLHLAWGFAKDFGLSGYKVGVLHTRDPQVRAVAQKLARFASVSSETQVLLRDLLADQAWTEGFLAESRARLGAAYESTVKALDGHGLASLPAGAGLFVWLDLRAYLPEPTFEAETALARRIFTEAKLNLAPGGTFHCPEPGWFRLCFATIPDSVTTAITRLADHLNR